MAAWERWEGRRGMHATGSPVLSVECENKRGDDASTLGKPGKQAEKRPCSRPCWVVRKFEKRTSDARAGGGSTVVVMCLDDAAWGALHGCLMTTGKCTVGLLGGHTKKKETIVAHGEKGGIGWDFVQKVFFFLLFCIWYFCAYFEWLRCDCGGGKIERLG